MEKFKFALGIAGDLFFGAAGVTALFPTVLLDIHTFLDVSNEFIILMTRVAIFVGVIIWVMKRYKQYKKM